MLRGCPSQHWAMFSLIFSLSNTTGQIWFSFLSCPIRNHPFVYSICTCYGLWTTQSETSLLLDKQPEPKPSLRDQRWIELPVCLLFWCTAFSPWLITRSPAVNLLLVRWEEGSSFKLPALATRDRTLLEVWGTALILTARKTPHLFQENHLCILLGPSSWPFLNAMVKIHVLYHKIWRHWTEKAAHKQLKLSPMNALKAKQGDTLQIIFIINSAELTQ